MTPEQMAEYIAEYKELSERATPADMGMAGHTIYTKGAGGELVSVGWFDQKVDARLYLCARALLPALLTEVERLTAELETAQAENARLDELLQRVANIERIRSMPDRTRSNLGDVLKEWRGAQQEAAR